jgi:DNA-directed RNA polymerase specialized sigma24 family protein
MDAQLEQLVRYVQQSDPDSASRQSALNQLVGEILRSRKLCRPFRGQLFGIYREIYDRAREQLLYDLDETIHHYNAEQIPVRTWIADRQTLAFREILADAQLCELAREAQRHPSQTPLRRYALGELVEAIRLSNRLCRPHRTKFSPEFYDLLYEEAVNKTLTYVCRHINNYDPDRGKFMTWVNFRLDRVVIESRREFSHPTRVDLPSLNDLDNLVQPENAPSLPEVVRNCLEEDRDKRFRRTYVRDRPEANFRAIALARLSGKTWEEISQELEVKIPTLSSFFQRCCEKFRPQFQDCL